MGTTVSSENLNAAIELAKELLGETRSPDMTEGEDPVNHIEVMRGSLLGGNEYTIDLVESLCEAVKGLSK